MSTVFCFFEYGKLEAYYTLQFGKLEDPTLRIYVRRFSRR
jgi:hypothetical protein